jgi:hypothetical protein
MFLLALEMLNNEGLALLGVITEHKIVRF